MVFGLFEIVFPLMFFIVTGFMVVCFARTISQWHKNNNSPRLTVEARVVSRRAHHSSHMTGGAAPVSTSSTSYYATFAFASGDRLELHLPSHDYAMLAEGDVGDLTFQGTRFLSFVRK